LHTIGPAHVFAAVQAILHLLPLHAIRCLQAPAPIQSTSHWLALLQSMVDAHEPAPVHVTLQGMPVGQTIGSRHVAAAVHVTPHVPTESHVPSPASAQIFGHASTALIGVVSAASASDVLPSLDVLPSPPPLASRPVSSSLVLPSSVA
jgi:hypothetical protein